MADNIFENKKKAQGEVKEQVDTHSKAILTVTQRQKDIEGSLDLLQEKIDLLDHNTVRNFRKLTEELKEAKLEIREIRGDIENLREFNQKVAKQLKLMTTKDEVSKLEKYIDLWEPLNFVTREELEGVKDQFKKEVEEIIEKFLKED